ncbi:MAG: hypothetical protein KDD45_02550 [Bdellovibrionales bacterium]|nr:hypothetical protein [Bdellovibrionales bacterium]
MVECPRCGMQVTELQALEDELLAQLEAVGESITTPVCLVCFSDLRKLLSQSKGGVLLAQERAKEQYRLDLWKNRVTLVRRARSLMHAKNFSQAAITYEKYLKILDIIFALKKGEILKPSHFKDSARTSEITVVTSVYWDLLRIYDTNEKYMERQQQAAKQLAVFIQYSPIYPDLMKKAQAFMKSAKKPQIIKSFIKEASSQRPRCFIASSSFENNFAPEVVYLRIFRDYFLNKFWIGQIFIRTYYIFSPALANFIDRSKTLRILTRALIKALIKCIRRIY